MTTYNCRDHFKISMESALSQDYPNLEIVVADGASTDGTTDLIKAYADRVNCGPDSDDTVPQKTIVWKSEKDHGIYDGMNKAIRMSSGDIIAVFNDEFTCPDAVSKYVKKLREGYDAVHSDLVYADGDVWKRYWHMPGGSLHTGWMPAHPTLYIRRSVYDTYGLYELQYRSSSDYEFMLRILRDKTLRLGYVPEILIKMFYGGTSSAGLKGYAQNTAEAYKALVKNRMAFPLTIIFCRILRTLHQYRQAKQHNRKNGTEQAK